MQMSPVLFLVACVLGLFFSVYSQPLLRAERWLHHWQHSSLSEEQATNFAARSEVGGETALEYNIHRTNRMVRSVAPQELEETASSHGGS